MSDVTACRFDSVKITRNRYPTRESFERYRAGDVCTITRTFADDGTPFRSVNPFDPTVYREKSIFWCLGTYRSRFYRYCLLLFIRFVFFHDYRSLRAVLPTAERVIVVVFFYYIIIICSYPVRNNASFRRGGLAGPFGSDARRSLRERRRRRQRRRILNKLNHTNAISHAPYGSIDAFGSNRAIIMRGYTRAVRSFPLVGEYGL